MGANCEFTGFDATFLPLLKEIFFVTEDSVPSEPKINLPLELSSTTSFSLL